LRKVLESSLLVEHPRSIMAIHLTASRCRIRVDIGVRVQLCEVLLNRELTDGKHESLIPVITGTMIPFAKHFGHRDLRHLFSIAKNAKLGLAHDHFLASADARVTALDSHPVITNNFFHPGL